jgi:hypothetical protein
MMRITTAAASLAAMLALGLGAAAQETDGETPDAPAAEAPAPERADPGQGYRDGRHRPEGRHGMMRGGMHGRHGGGHGMMGGGQGRMRHGGHGQRPTLKIETKGRGFEIEFECNAAMEQCLEAIDRVYEIAGERRRERGMMRGDDGEE